MDIYAKLWIFARICNEICKSVDIYYKLSKFHDICGKVLKFMYI